MSTAHKTSPTVLNVNYEEITLNYISSLLISDKEIKNNVDMNLVQEELFVYSQTKETTNDNLGKTKEIADTQIIAKTILLFRHYDFYLRGNCAIIGAGKMCSTEVGKKSLMSRPKIRGLNFFEKGSYTAKNTEFSIL